MGGRRRLDTRGYRTAAIFVALLVAAAGSARADEPVVAGLHHALKDPAIEVRLQTVEWLAQAVWSPLEEETWSSAIAVEPLLLRLPAELLAQDEPQQRFYQALATLPTLARVVEPAIVTAARSAPLTVRVNAIPVLARLEHPAAATLTALLDLSADNDDNVRTAAKDALQKLTKQFANAPTLVGAAVAKTATRPKVLAMLADGWMPAMASIDPLFDALDDPVPETVALAISALQRRHSQIEARGFAMRLAALGARKHDVAEVTLCGLAPFVAPDDDHAITSCLGSPHRGDVNFVITAYGVGAVPTEKVKAQLRTLAKGNDNFAELAIQALGAIGDRRDIDLLIGLLASSTRRSALDALVRIDRESAEQQLAIIAIATKSASPVQLSTAWGQALHVSGSIDATVRDRLLALLEDPAKSESIQSILLTTPALARQLAPFLPDALKKQRSPAIVAVAEATPATPEELKGFVELLRDSKLTSDVLEILGGHPSEALPYADAIAAQLASLDAEIAGKAVTALAKLGMADRYETAIVKLADSKNEPPLRSAAVRALGSALAKHHALAVAALADENTAADAISSLAQDPITGREFAPQMVPFVRSDELGLEARAARAALGRLAPLRLEEILAILELAQDDTAHAARYRMLAWISAGADGTAQSAIRWLGLQAPDVDSMSLREARRTLTQLEKLWPSTVAKSKTRQELGRQIGAIVAAAPLELVDIGQLERLRSRMEGDGDPSADRVANRLLWLRIRRVALIVAGALVIHLLVWIVLITIYPYSAFVQALFFWTPAVRRYLGLGYVGVLVARVAFLRQRLLAPFEARFAEDMRDTKQAYFPESEAAYTDDTGKETHARVIDALPRIEGRVTLVGDSGLGKSMYLQWLVRESRRTTIFLLAERCADGVVAAVKSKLRDFVTDEHFLETLLYTGGIDLCIDGLNEVDPTTRAAISQFVRGNPHTNVVLATQPLADWHPPGKVFRLQPLSKDQARRFLESRFAEDAKTALSRAEYVAACAACVDAAFAETPDNHLRDALITVMSNPMDLTTIAELLLARRQPDLLRLQQQQYLLAAADFRAATGQDFSLDLFSEQIFTMRSQGVAEIPAEVGRPQLEALEGRKLVFRRAGSDDVVRWYFRHDKILEFFVLQTFLKVKDRAGKFLDDPRFRGVYFLMALTLPLDAATLLRDQLVLHAAKNNDHTVSDHFVKLLESRKLTTDGEPEWMIAYHLPAEVGARQRLATAEQKESIARQGAADVRRELEGWQRCRSALSETLDDRLVETACRLLEQIGATFERTGGAGGCNGTAMGTRFLLQATASNTALDVIHVASAFKDSDRRAGELALLVVNIKPSTVPDQRSPWLTSEAVARARTENIVCITAHDLVRSVAAMQANEISHHELWASLALASGLWLGLASRPEATR